MKEDNCKNIIFKMTKENIAKCYQCGKCTAGCPMAFMMDIKPNQIIRFLQLDMPDKVLKSKSIWYCASCQTCFSRCPQEVDLSKIMDALCQLSKEKNLVHKDVKNIEKFHKSFLNALKMAGLSNELLFLAEYKLKSGKLFDDLLLAPKMLFKGKLKLLPKRIKNMNAIKKMFNKMKEREN